MRHDRPDGWHQPDAITGLAPAYENDTDIDELRALMAVGSTGERFRFLG